MSNSLLYNRLYKWYERNHRDLPWRETEEGYRIWLSEVILQQTRVAQGMDYYLRFVSRWPSTEALAAAEEDEVLREWQGLGYYSRARNLHKAAKLVVERGWLPFPTRYEDIRQLPGIGEYTAGAIASFAYNLPYPAMDGNVYRVIARLFDIDEPFDTTAGKKIFRLHNEQLFDKAHPRRYNSAIMEFGALYCTPVLGDNCTDCPIQMFCQAYAHGTAEWLPVRKQRPQLRERWLDYHIYISRETTTLKDIRPCSIRMTPGSPLYSKTEEVFTLIQRRENAKDIWYRLYEFPCEELSAAPPKEKSGNRTSGEEKTVAFTHILSHQRIHARFFLHHTEALPAIPDTIRVGIDELDQYAFSRLTLRALERLRGTD